MKCRILVFVLLFALFVIPACAQNLDFEPDDTEEKWEHLQLEEENESVRKSDSREYLIAVGISFAVSLIVCLILKAGMKNVHIKKEANAYILGGLNLTVRSDRFTHRTEIRTKIEKQSSTAKSGGR